MEVHQRRESLRLFGIEESRTADSDEDTKQVLVDFLEDMLGIAIAREPRISKGTPYWKIQ